MAETTITGPRMQAAPVSTFTEFNVRQEQGTPHFIRLHDRVVKALERELSAATGEVFGVLVGSVDDAEDCTIHVEGFEPSVHHEQGMLNVVGYYRAHSGADFALDAVDMARFEHWFPENVALALLLKRPQAGPWTAMFFLGADGNLAADQSTVEFPFNLHALGAEEPLPAPAPPPVALSQPSPPRRARWKTALVSTAVIGGLIGLYGFRHPAPAPVKTPAPIAEPAAAEPQVAQPGASTRESADTGKTTELAKQPSKAAIPPASPPIVKPAPKKPAPALEVRRVPPPPALPSAPPAVPAPQPQTQTAPIGIPVAAAIPPPAAVATVPAVKPPEPVMPLIPPRPIRQSAPKIKEDLRRAIQGEVMIRVRVYVDRNGKVTGADPLNATNHLADGLADAAIISVKRWQFEPARRGDEKVPGEVELTFTFRK